jgi:diguanylate cyclase (GGDEF)-like protein
VLVGEVVARISRSDANARFELAKAFEAQRELAWRDPLTGLYNRRAFIELGSAIVAGAASRGQAPAALFLDLDGLKTINDTWGHETGDALIAQAGRLIASSAPAGSICARLGGDEFCVLAESEDQARLAMGQVAQAQAQLPAHPSGATLSLSIGIGVASLQGQGTAEAVDMPGLTIDDMLNTADRDMLAHKRARDRVRRPASAEQSLDRAPLG